MEIDVTKQKPTGHAASAESARMIGRMHLLTAAFSAFVALLFWLAGTYWIAAIWTMTTAIWVVGSGFQFSTARKYDELARGEKQWLP